MKARSSHHWKELIIADLSLHEAMREAFPEPAQKSFVPGELRVPTGLSTLSFHLESFVP